MEYIMLRKDFEIEYYFPENWLLEIHQEHPSWFKSFILDVDDKIASLEVEDGRKNNFQNHIFERMKSSLTFEWLEPWLPLLRTIELSLSKQNSKLKSM